MNKNKSKAAYTTIWLNRNKQFWHEVDYFGGTKKLVIDKPDAPKIVLKRVREINDARIGLKQVTKQIKMLERQLKNPTKPQ